MDNNDALDIFGNLSELEIVSRCGELCIPLDRVAVILANKYHRPLDLYIESLSDPDSTLIKEYENGVAIGEAKVAATLEANLDNPKIKDAYKSMASERRRVSINRKLSDLFGL
ncbi:hypothetical protein MASR1M31_04650 [Porphyromonadaceae bacterium]